MFSINSRWFMANNTGLLKARGHRKGQNRFWPLAAGQKGQKLAGCSSLCRTAVCACTRARTPSAVRARTAAVHTVLFTWLPSAHHSVQEYSCSVVHQNLCFLSSPPLSLFTNLL